MRFTDRKTLFTDGIPLLSICSIRTDRQTVYNHSCHENILSPTNEMRFTDRKTLFTDRIPLLSIRSIRTDRHMAYTDRYGAGVLDNPQYNWKMKVLPLHSEQLDLRVARMTTYHGVPSQVGDVKILSPISTFVLNTLTLK